MANNKYNYQLVSNEIEVEGQNITTYGIRALDENRNELMLIEDISDEREWVERLIYQFTKFDLCPEHLLCAVEDFLLELPRHGVRE